MHESAVMSVVVQAVKSATSLLAEGHVLDMEHGTTLSVTTLSVTTLSVITRIRNYVIRTTCARSVVLVEVS